MRNKYRKIVRSSTLRSSKLHDLVRHLKLWYVNCAQRKYCFFRKYSRPYISHRDDQQRYTNIKAYVYMMGTENRRVVKMVQTMERKVRNKYRRIVKNSVPVDSKLYDFVTVDISQLVRCQLC